MASKPRIVIVVDCGGVVDTYTNTEMDVLIIDYDDLDKQYGRNQATKDGMRQIEEFFDGEEYS